MREVKFFENLLETNERRLHFCILRSNEDMQESPLGSARAELLDKLQEEILRHGHTAIVASPSASGVIVRESGGTQSHAPQDEIDLPELVAGSESQKVAYRTYYWLREKHFDIVIAPLLASPIFYAVTAKSQGINFSSTVFCVIGDRLTFLECNLKKRMPEELDDLINDDIERKSLGLADIGIFQTAEASGWVQTHGWPSPRLALRFDRATSPELSETSQARYFISKIVSWTEVERSIKGRTLEKDSQGDKLPLVSACITHFNRPRLLRQAVESLRLQTYQRLEIIVVDDASSDPEAIRALDEVAMELEQNGGRLIRHEVNRYLGAARNTAVRSASGDYVLFLDDDDYAKPEQVATLVAVAMKTGADVVNSFCDRLFEDEPPRAGMKARERWLMLGNAPGVGIFKNYFGPASALFKKQSFQSIGGFTESRGVGHEDWELFAECSLSGLNLQLVPEALFWYRQTAGSMVQSMDVYESMMRNLAPYLSRMPPNLRPALFFTVGISQRLPILREQMGQLREQIVQQQNMLADLIRANDELRARSEELEWQEGRQRQEINDLASACRIMLRVNPDSEPQDAVEAVWRSRSRRLTKPLRQLRSMRNTAPVEVKPQINSWQEAAAFVTCWHRSISYELLGPLRAVAHLLSKGLARPRG